MRLVSFVACLAVVGITSCASPHQASLPDTSGQRMTEAQVLSSATELMPPQVGDSFHVSFKNGVWKVSCESSDPARNGRVVAVRDSDGKAELQPPNIAPEPN
jgi:membrane protein implicated in regulation of membrane protease activity